MQIKLKKKFHRTASENKTEENYKLLNYGTQLQAQEDSMVQWLQTLDNFHLGQMKIYVAEF